MFDVDSYSFDGPIVYNGDKSEKLDRDTPRRRRQVNPYDPWPLHEGEPAEQDEDDEGEVRHESCVSEQSVNQESSRLPHLSPLFAGIEPMLMGK